MARRTQGTPSQKGGHFLLCNTINSNNLGIVDYTWDTFVHCSTHISSRSSQLSHNFHQVFSEKNQTFIPFPLVSSVQSVQSERALIPFAVVLIQHLN